MAEFDELAANAPDWYTDVVAALGRDKRDEAMRIARSGLTKSRDASDAFGEMMALRALVKGYIAKGDAWKGKQSATDALELAKRLKDKKAEAAAVLLLAKVNLREKVMDAAGQRAQEAVDMFKSIGFKEGEAAALNTLANVRMTENRLDEAFGLANKAIELFKACNERRGEVSVLHTSIQIKFREERLFHALCIAQEMADLYAAVQDVRGEGIAHLLAAEVHLTQDCFQEAMSSASLAADRFDDVGDANKKAKAVQAMARAFAGAGQDSDATQAAQAALDMFLGTRDKRGQAEALTTLAVGFAAQGQDLKAVGPFMDAAFLYKKLKDKQEETKVVGKLAQSQCKLLSMDGMNWSKKQLDEAVQSGERLVAMFVDLGATDSEGYGYALLGLSIALFYVKASEQAIARAEEAQQLFSTLGELSGEAYALLSIARALHQQDKANLENAISMATRAKDIAEEAYDQTTLKDIKAYLKSLGLVVKKKVDTQTTAPVDVEYIHHTLKIIEIDHYQGRSTTMGGMGQSSSSAGKTMALEEREDYNPASYKTPIKEQVLYTMKWHKMPRGDRAKLVLPESQRAAIAA